GRENDIAVIGSTGDPEEGIALVVEREPDLLFVDVQMPVMDGIEMVRRIPDGSLPLVVFVTAFDEYAVRAFDLSAVDYVLKPVDAGRFHVAAERAKERLDLSRGAGTPAIRKMLDSPSAAADRVVVESNGRMRLLRLEDIEWI